MARTLLAAVVALLLIAAPAHASGTVTVNIAGAGHVTGDGLDCTQTLAGVKSGTCAHFVEDEIGTLDQCFPQEAGCPLPGSQLVNADAPAPGFAFDRWSGFCGRTNPCSLPISTTFGSNVTVTVTYLDVAAPTSALTQPVNGSAVSGRIPLTAAATDNAGSPSVVFRVRGTVLPALTTPPFTTVFDTQTLPDGPAAITATATDAAAHSTASAPANVTIDNTRPALTVTGPDGQTLGPGVTPAWTIAASDATTGPPAVRCSVVAAGAAPAFGACTSATSERLPGQPDGRYTLTVRATDRAGNAADSTRAFAVDGGPPETTITSGPQDGESTVGTAVAWGFESSEPGSTFECRVYASSPGPFGPCSSGTQHSAGALAPGTYTFEVRATDAVGNTDATPARRTVTIVDPGVFSGGPGRTAVPVVNVALTYHYRKLNARATDLDRLVVQSVPAGSTVSVSCPKGCSKKRFLKTGASGTISLKVLLKKPLKVKTRITVTVSKPGAVSAVKVLTIRPRKPPSIVSLCLPPGAKKAAACA